MLLYIAVLLIMVSQRVEIPTLDNPGTSFVKESKTELRGAPATTIEWMILAYVAGKLLRLFLAFLYSHI